MQHSVAHVFRFLSPTTKLSQQYGSVRFRELWNNLRTLFERLPRTCFSGHQCTNRDHLLQMFHLVLQLYKQGGSNWVVGSPCLSLGMKRAKTDWSTRLCFPKRKGMNQDLAANEKVTGHHSRWSCRPGLISLTSPCLGTKDAEALSIHGSSFGSSASGQRCPIACWWHPLSWGCGRLLFRPHPSRQPVDGQIPAPIGDETLFALG